MICQVRRWVLHGLGALVLAASVPVAAEVLHLTNLPPPPKSEKVSKNATREKGESVPQPVEGKENLLLSADNPRAQAAFLAIDDVLLTKYAADPFFKSKIRLFSRFGPSLLNSTIPPEYWTQTVDFAYSVLSAQTQHMLKALQRMETTTRKRYELDMASHLKNPRLYRRPTLDLEPIYLLRRQLIELSAP